MSVWNVKLACKKKKKKKKKAEAWAMLLQNREVAVAAQTLLSHKWNLGLRSVVLRNCTIRQHRCRSVWTHLRNNSPFYTENCDCSTCGVGKGVGELQDEVVSLLGRLATFPEQRLLMCVKRQPDKDIPGKTGIALRLPSLEAGEEEIPMSTWKI